jgi:hypothetical protein
MNLYFFHNVHGESQDLIEGASSLEGVHCIPYGWDEQTESRRDQLCEKLGILVPALPAVAFFVPNCVISVGGEQWPYPQHWECRTVHEMQATTWVEIEAWIADFVAARLRGEPFPAVQGG